MTEWGLAVVHGLLTGLLGVIVSCCVFGLLALTCGTCFGLRLTPDTPFMRGIQRMHGWLK